jgi:hypothetical protein
MILAGIPSKPTDVPVSDPTVTSDTQIKVSWANPVPADNGSPILSYELQMDDGVTGDFVSILGFDANSLLKTKTVTVSVIKGRQHRFKYRAKNLVGWGPFSADSFVFAATKPRTPPIPYFDSFIIDTLSIAIPRSEDNGGSVITSYELWVDDGNDFTSSFH